MRELGSGAPEPLGVTPVPGGVNVAVYSKNAAAIELCLFDADGRAERERIGLPARSDEVFHGFIGGVAAGDRYGLRAHGPYDTRAGHRFNPAKLLIDPYARAIDRRFAFDPVLVGGAAAGHGRDEADSASAMPKAIVTAAPQARPVRRPQVPWADTVIYELHVRGFTRAHPDIPEGMRGTCAALAHPAAIAHLTRLGVTTVELLPIAAAIDEPHLARLGLTNYWGYNPAALFVPDPRLAPGGIDELAACVAALHESGMEVILDVVVNHTGEGNAYGPTISWRGLDNAIYYRVDANDGARYIDTTGCGNTMALDRRPVVRLVIDVLRYYAEAAGVDGFRFDLATTLGRVERGFDARAPLIAAIMEDPLLSGLKLIAEPWDLGPGGHQLGAFPAPWAEWNDRYRDTVRRFWRGDAQQIGTLATSVAGSADVFSTRSRAPSRSINFVTAHDGFTLADLVSYTGKRNEANGENNRDGTDTNFSWNNGVEGATSDSAVVAARRRDVRNMLATLLCSRGTPMLMMGDELGRTQRGNNNGYAQDGELTWLGWQNVDVELARFVAGLIALRRRHPALRTDRWLTGAPIDGSGIPDVEWRRADGVAMSGGDWTDPERCALVAALYVCSDDDPSPDRVAFAFNAARAPLDVVWPAPRNGFRWMRCIDTSAAQGCFDPPLAVAEEKEQLAARSVVVLAETRDPAAQPGASEDAESMRRRGGGIELAVLARLAAAAGIAADWWDIGGRLHVVTSDTQRALLAAMGLAVGSTDDARARLIELAEGRERRGLPSIVIAHAGAPSRVAIAGAAALGDRHAALRLDGEDGESRTLAFRAADLPRDEVTATDGSIVARGLVELPPLPQGYYTLAFDDDDRCTCRIVVAPRHCYVPPELRGGGRRFGLTAQLYALRRHGDQGIGDFTTLAATAEATAGAGGSIVGINPLHALFAGDRGRASPYHPSDRRFIEPLYIDVARVPDLAGSDEARALLAGAETRIAALSAAANVDYAGVWNVKQPVLEACFARFVQRGSDDPLVAEFERFVAAGGDALRQFALFEAIAAAHPRRGWQGWPVGLRHPAGAEAAEFAARHADRIRFVQYLQWLADRQLAHAAAHARRRGLALGFLRDLAVGAAPDGAEPWSSPDGFARGASIGAPPDSFSTAGQNWSLPPPDPEALCGFKGIGLRPLLAANMRHAGALRIDHVMGLSRLYWIPDGATAEDGAYVRYPFDALLAVVALESVRAQCLVVGEDLGTVPEGLREQLAAADVFSYRVVWFEREGNRFKPPSTYPANAVACVSTHDLPTIAGWWNGADIAEKEVLGLVSAETAEAERSERLASKRALADALHQSGVIRGAPPDVDAPHDVAVTAAIHRFAGATPAALALVQADDLAGESHAVNLPGTDRVRANWRRKVDGQADALWQTPAGVQAEIDLAPTRGAPNGAGPEDGARAGGDLE